MSQQNESIILNICKRHTAAFPKHYYTKYGDQTPLISWWKNKGFRDASI